MDPQTSTEEIWKPVYGWEGRYEVSCLGRVRSIQFHGRIRSMPKILSVHVRGRGYLSVPLNRPNLKCLRQVHALVLEAFDCPRPEGMQVRHLNGDPKDNRPSNLCWGTPKENQADRRLHGTYLHGENHPRARFEWTDIRRMRKLREAGYLLCEIASEFQTSESHVSEICRGRIWREQKETR